MLRCHTLRSIYNWCLRDCGIYILALVETQSGWQDERISGGHTGGRQSADLGPGPLPVVSVTPESADTTSHTVKYSPNCSHEDIHLSVRLLIRPLCPVPVHSPRRSRLLRDLTMTSSSSLNFVPPTNDTFLAFSSVDLRSILQLTILHFLLPRNDVYDFPCPPVISTTFIFLLRITLQLLLSSPRT